MKRGILVLLLTLLFLGTIVTAETVVKMVFWPGPEAEAMQEVVNYYNENISPRSGIKVEMVLFGREGFFEKQATILAGRSSEVDLIFTTSYIIHQHAPYLEPLEPYFANPKLAGTGEVETFIESVRDSFTIDDKLYGIPTDASITTLLYRKDLVDRIMSDPSWTAGYKELALSVLGEELEPKPAEEWNWDDFYVTTLFLSRKHNPESPTTYGTALQAKAMWPNGKVWSAIMKSMGGSWFDDQGNPTFNTPEAHAALKLYADIMRAEAAPPGSVNYEYTEPNEAMKTQSAAMIFQWGVAFTELSNPEASPAIWDKVAIAPYPAGDGGHTVWLTSMGVGLSRWSRNKEAAFEWLAFLSTPKAMRIYGSHGGVPPVTSVLEDLGKDSPIFSHVKEYLEQYAFSYVAGTETVDVLRVLATAISEVTALTVTPEAALRNVQRELDYLGF